ncbi:Uncharacterised protein [Mycobacteroides abscessus]|nr:Uncharacterised protein [Mycobacteroides abscessus]
MERVDRLHEERLLLARRPVQRVERQPAVDPAGGVARVQGVGQRREQVLEPARRLAREVHVAGAVVVGQVGRREAADEKPRELALAQRVEVGPRALDEPQAHLVRHDLAVEHPRPRLRDRERLREEVVQLDDLDAPVRQLVDEVEVVALGGLHPHDVVEEEVVGVRRGQPLVRQPRCADEDLAQAPHLRVDAVLRGRDGGRDGGRDAHGCSLSVVRSVRSGGLTATPTPPRARRRRAPRAPRRRRAARAPRARTPAAPARGAS